MINFTWWQELNTNFRRPLRQFHNRFTVYKMLSNYLYQNKGGFRLLSQMNPKATSHNT